jgi:hypothetical protein
MDGAASGRFFPTVVSLVSGVGWRRSAGPGSAFLQIESLRLPWLKQWSGRFLNPVERVIAVLSAYRNAVDAEREGRFTRADFCWRELKRRLVAAWNGDLWRAAVAVAVRDFEMAEADGEAVRDAFIREVVIETLVAFYRVHAGAKTAGGHARASVSRQYAAEIFDICHASAEDVRSTLVPMLEAEYHAFANSKEWRRAIAAAAELARRAPGDIVYEDMLAYAIHADALHRMNNVSGEVTARQNADVLRRAIAEIEKVRGAYPANATMYTVLSSLFHLRAVQLANSGSVSIALIEAEKAAAYNADEDGIDETRKSLKELMTQRVAASKEMLARVKAMPNARLNSVGEVLRADASAAFAPLSIFEASQEPKAIAHAVAVARGKTLFRRVGLPVPTDEALNGLAGGLWEIISAPPENAEAIPTAWAEAVGHRPELAGYPAETVNLYLQRRLFGQDEKSAPAPPAIDTVAPSPRRSVEPIGRWLFSREGAFAKTLLAAALAVLLWTSLSAIGIRKIGVAHDAAFVRLEAAVSAHDDAGTIAAAETFFRTAEVQRDSAREAHVMNHYREAMVRWFIRNPGRPDANALRRVAEYKRIAHDFPPAEVMQ